MSDTEIEEYKKSFEERIANIEKSLEDEELSDSERKIYEELLEKLKDTDYQAEQEAIKKTNEEKFEASKTTIVESKTEIDNILNKYGLIGDKNAISIIKTIEEQYGFIILTMIDTNMEVFSKLNLENIVINVKGGVPKTWVGVPFEEEDIKAISENKDFNIIQKIAIDGYVEFLNSMIAEPHNNNMIVSNLLTSLNFMSESSMKPQAIINYNVKFF